MSSPIIARLYILNEEVLSTICDGSVDDAFDFLNSGEITKDYNEIDSSVTDDCKKVINIDELTLTMLLDTRRDLIEEEETGWQLPLTEHVYGFGIDEELSLTFLDNVYGLESEELHEFARELENFNQQIEDDEVMFVLIEDSREK